eukprot:jgi/Chrzof1/1614/Cz10g14190.t1
MQQTLLRNRAGPGMGTGLPKTLLGTYPVRSQARHVPSRLHAVLEVNVDGPQTAQDVVTYLTSQGVEVGPLHNVLRRNPWLQSVSIKQKIKPVLQYLLDYGCTIQDIQIMLVKCPSLFSFQLQDKIIPAVAFLHHTQGMSQHDIRTVIRRFPPVLSYDVKGQLIPQVAYLKSLGVSQEDLPGLILARPQVLSNSIDLVVTYLTKWLGIKRRHVGKLLRTYPIEYALPQMSPPTMDSDDDSSSP